MRLGLSGNFLDSPMTGSGQYVLNLLRELVALTSEELVVFCPAEGSSRVAERLIEAGANLSVVWVPVPFGENLGKVWFEQAALPRACQRYGVELLHVPYFGSPLLKPCKTVVTIHDLIMLALPQHQGSLLVRLYTTLAAASARRADLVIADSECTKKDVTRLLGIRDEKIQVIPLACEERFRPVEDTAKLGEVRLKYGLGPRFILYMGGFDWRKNVASLIRAFAQVGGDWQLAIAGKLPSSKNKLYPDLTEVVKKSDLEGRVRFIGFVAEEDKPTLYAAASLFVFPSRYEGFGLTSLEAMACGTPLLCSNAASLPEVVGDGGMLFDPEDEKGLAEAMNVVLSSEALRAELRQRGLRQAQRFSWHHTAEATLIAYKAVLHGRKAAR